MTKARTRSTAPPTGPRERLARVGAPALSDEELVALLLGTGGRGEPVLALARKLLERWHGTAGLARMQLGGLAQVPGVGTTKAARLLAAAELGRRLAARPLERGARLHSSRDVDLALRPHLAHASTEQFLAIPLDAKHRAMGQLRIASGGMTACHVSPADVFRALLLEAAPAAVFVHNHPSGEPSPSPEDVAFTERLCHLGQELGIRVVDHVIVAQEGYFSFLDAGLLAGARRAA